MERTKSCYLPLAFALVASVAGCKSVPRVDGPASFVAPDLSREIVAVPTPVDPADEVRDSLQAADHLVQQGKPEEALTVLQGVLTREPQHARANEIHAKALIRNGCFLQALAHLDIAEIGYSEGSPDALRLNDIRTAARGLEAYAQARPREARKLWAELREPALRDSLRRAVAKVSSD